MPLDRDDPKVVDALSWMSSEDTIRYLYYNREDSDEIEEFIPTNAFSLLQVMDYWIYVYLPTQYGRSPNKGVLCWDVRSPRVKGYSSIPELHGQDSREENILAVHYLYKEIEQPHG